MESKFELGKLVDVATITSGKRPPSSTKEACGASQVPIVGGGGVSGFTEQALFSKPVFVTGRVGTLGKLFAFDAPTWPSDNALVVLANEEWIDRNFLRYALQAVIHQAAGMNRGAANPLVTQGDLGHIPIPLVPRSEQQRIASVLKVLDDRIESLHKANRSIEAIAQTLFKSWFVDFDPVHAKAEGREPEGMDAATAALFPSELEDSELGPIPKGWSARALNEALEINPRRVLKKGIVAPYLDMASIPTVGCTPMAPIQREFSSGSKFTNGDTLLARITPCLENGKTAYVSCLENGQVGWGSTEFIVLRPYSPLPSFFAYLLARRVDFRAHAIQSMSGTSGRQRVEITRLKDYLVTIPNEAVADAFASTVEPIERMIFANAKHADCLADLRDTLLPRLISGKLRLPEAEREIEAATA